MLHKVSFLDNFSCNHLCYHNIGAGGVDNCYSTELNFSSSRLTLRQAKRWNQRAARVRRKLGLIY